jgi:8-oxo-dGTP diphosphatase
MQTKYPLLTVDCVVFDRAGRLLLIRRKHPPFQGRYALPGGFVEYGETIEQAATRELLEETNLVATTLLLIGVYSDPHRDPRSHVVSIAYLATARQYDSRAGGDASETTFIADWDDKELAFDHRQIVRDARALMKQRKSPTGQMQLLSGKASTRCARPKTIRLERRRRGARKG